MSQLTFAGFDPAEVINAAGSNQLQDPGKLSQDMCRKIYPLTADIINHKDVQRGIEHIIRRVGNHRVQIIANNTNYLRNALQRDAEQICWHCLVTSDLWPPDYKPWAVIVDEQYSVNDDEIICYGIGYCCSAECALAAAKFRTATGDPYWKNAERLTYNSIRRVYPHKVDIKPAPDYILRDILGAGITAEEMTRIISSKSQWIPQQNIKIIPCAQSYSEVRRAV